MHEVDRRAVLAHATVLGAASLLPGRALAQGATTGQAADRPAASLPARGEFVVRGAHVLTMDPALGDLPTGDVHVRDGAIVAVGATIAAAGADAIDGRGMICMPGFVETHWHLWTSLLRPIVRADDGRYGYFPVTARLGPHFTPQDSYRSVRLGLAQALSSGITTVHNWAHNVRSPAHADAEIAAMRDSGMRGRFSYGTPQGLPNGEPMDLADLARLKRDWPDRDGLLALGMCSRNVGNDPNPLRGNITPEMTKKEWGAAHDLGLAITLHTSGPSPVKLLDEAGLLGPHVQLVHPLLTTADERATLAARGVGYSMAPLGESRRPASAGVIQLGELMESGVKISMSIDHTTTLNCDCFACMRTLYNLHQHRIGERIKLTSRRLVELATIDGARDLGIADKAGSLTPGKRADLILVRTTDVNMVPVGDPYEALVGLAEPDNVDTVVADGRILRRGGKFTALDHAQLVRDAMDSAGALRARANWP
ncbi:MAG TPA: amidohydrolase family protein [Xanthobacteraceae bacterium]|nr:amidohydrolase family protein [Xanthobacteraceae bacterium]